MLIDVLEFKLPNGEQIPRQLEIDDSCREKYDQLIEDGYRLTFEFLSTGVGSICVEHPDAGDYLNKLLFPGTDDNANKRKMEEMIKEYDRDKAAQFIKFMANIDSDATER